MYIKIWAKIGKIEPYKDCGLGNLSRVYSGLIGA